MKLQLDEKQLNYFPLLSQKGQVFLSGRLKNNLISLPKEWKDFVDLSSITVHLTPIGANQNLIVKGVQELEVRLQSNGLPIDCYYLILANVLDTAEIVC